jgi:hypothetical protein
MLGKCYAYALETFFDLHTSLSCGTVTVGGAADGLHFENGSAPQVSIPELGAAPVLVHGPILGDSGDIKDKKFGHAWIEGNGHVVDCGSAEKSHLLVDRDVYYKYWRIKPEECQRYSIQEATEFILSTGADSGWREAPAASPAQGTVEQLSLAGAPDLLS